MPARLMFLGHGIALAEALLAASFGQPWAEYRARTKRLIPGVY